MVVDMHCDTLSKLMEDKRRGRPYSLFHNGHHLDIEKMGRGNYLLQCFAVYIDLAHTSEPLLDAVKMIDLYYEELDKYQEFIAPVYVFSDLAKNQENGKLSAMLTVEEGDICMGSVEVLRQLYRLGVRMMTLTWNYENRLASANGLKEKGFEFIKEMERLHMVIDVSHLSDGGFWDICRHTARPFVASHSNARALCPNVRNLTDDMIRAMAKRGCVIGLNYYGAFLAEGGRDKEIPLSRIRDMVRHVKYITDLGGVEIMALGSDFDGIGGELELEDASFLPKLYDALLKAGFHESDADKIFSKNALRVFSECLSG